MRSSDISLRVFQDVKILCRQFCPAELKKAEAQFTFLDEKYDDRDKEGDEEGEGEDEGKEEEETNV